MQAATAETDRTIAVLSEHYLESAYCAPEWAAAFVSDPKGKKHKLLPVRITKCKPEGLLVSVVYLDLVGMDEQNARERLLEGVKIGRAKPKMKPAFPATHDLTNQNKPLSSGKEIQKLYTQHSFSSKPIFHRSRRIAE